MGRQIGTGLAGHAPFGQRLLGANDERVELSTKRQDIFPAQVGGQLNGTGQRVPQRFDLSRKLAPRKDCSGPRAGRGRVIRVRTAVTVELTRFTLCSRHIAAGRRCGGR